MEKNNEYYMKLALVEAKKAFNHGEVPVGAIIVYQDKIIARAYNKKEKKSCVDAHAEILAIRKASKKLKNWRLNECSLYVTLEPCPMCASAIQQSRIETVYCGVRNSDLNNRLLVEKIFSGSKNNGKVMLVEKILEENCQKILKDFFSTKRLQ